MKFTFNGTEFRLTFRHEKSRRTGDHVGHTVEIMPGGRMYCAFCRLFLSSVPKEQRKRKTWCVIQYSPSADTNSLGWIYFVSGCGTPNEKMGDQFNREEGRKHSLANALLERPKVGVAGIMDFAPLPKAFRATAWKAFHQRGASHVIDSHFVEVPEAQNVAGK